MRGGRLHVVALAAVVVVVAVLLAVGLVTLVVLDDGWTRVIWAAVGALLLWQLVPRPQRPSPRAVRVTTTDAPALLALVDEVAATVGARPPDSVAVDTVYATTLVPVGYRGRATLVLGLPQWTALDDDERIATLAHELACGEPARSPGRHPGPARRRPAHPAGAAAVTRGRGAAARAGSRAVRQRARGARGRRRAGR